MNRVGEIHAVLQKHAEIKRSTHPLFFKTAPGEYAAHDKFMGVAVPTVRKVAKDFAHISLDEIHQLLMSAYNEERLLALFILVMHYQKADVEGKNDLYQFYLNNMSQVNNWNLVDSSAHLIIGAHVWNGGTDILIRYAKSDNLWERRIAILSTLYFIRKKECALTFAIAKLLLHDAHDLIHKAVGWMLREAGKEDIQQLEAFLNEFASQMPRTMLRYAIEKFPEDQRKIYLKK